MELFIERLIREFSPANASNFGGTIRLRQAAEMRVFSPMLCNAFEAASLTFAGSRQQNRSLEMAGHARYIRVLRQLQSALYHPDKSQATDALTVVLLSTIIEVSPALHDSWTHRLISLKGFQTKFQGLHLETSAGRSPALAITHALPAQIWT